MGRAGRGATLVLSTSWTCVRCAEVCNDSTMRVAITLRSRLNDSVWPRRGLGVAVGAGADGVLGADGGAAAAGAFAASAAASTSCLRIRPPTPVPWTDARSTPCSAAILRTSGVT